MFADIRLCKLLTLIGDNDDSSSEDDDDDDDDDEDDDDDDVEPFDTGWCRGLRESFGLRLHPPFVPSTWLAPTATIGI